MLQARRDQIESAAEELLEQYSAISDLPIEKLLPIKPHDVVTRFLGLRYEEVDDLGDGQVHGSILGVLDRRRNFIAVSSKLPSPQKRVIAMHQVCHFIYDLDFIYHRERCDDHGSREERAEVFAAAFLMPRRPVCEVFSCFYGGQLALSEIDEDFAFRLSLGTGEQVPLGRLFRAAGEINLRELARLLAKSRCPDVVHGKSLAEAFGVSVFAMERRLVELPVFH